MIRTFNYPLKPTKNQEATLDQWLYMCQQLYNAGLEQRREAYRKQGKSLSRYDQHKDLTDLRGSIDEFSLVPTVILRSALDRLDVAYKAFFRRVKKGETPGHPRFKNRDRYNSFSFPKPKFHGKSIAIPNFGNVKIHLYRSIPDGAIIREAKVKRHSTGKWVVSFVLFLGEAKKKVAIKTSTGIDVGIENLATLADGEKIENPRFFRQGETLLATRQRILSKKHKGSNRRKRAKKLVAKAHEHVKNQRLDFARKVAKDIVERYDLIAYEKLNIKDMIENGYLGKSITDASWSILLNSITCKAEEAGKHTIAIDPRGTSQMCSSCGKEVKKDLAQRMHTCPHCDLRIHRDHNAAINIHTLGLSVLETTQVVKSAVL